MIAAQVENLALCRELLMIYATDQVTAQNKASRECLSHSLNSSSFVVVQLCIKHSALVVQ